MTDPRPARDPAERRKFGYRKWLAVLMGLLGASALVYTSLA